MSRDYKGKRIVVYPEYLDLRRSRSEGRRVRRDKAVPNPKIEEIMRAAEELGLNPTYEEASYPRNWWEHRGRVIVDKKDSKQSILRRIAEKIREYRR